MFSTQLAALALVLTTATAPVEPLAAPLVPMMNASQPEPWLQVAGQPTAQELRDAVAAGYVTVIDLRAPNEDRGFDEAALLRELGVPYVNLPVTPDTLDGAVVQRFLDALATAKRPVLLHCGSANRASALLYGLWRQGGASAEAALERAKASGLKSLPLIDKVEPAVAGAAPAVVTHGPGVTAFAAQDEVYRRFSAAYDKLDSAAAAANYTADVLYLAPGDPARRGRPAVEQTFREFFLRMARAGVRLAIRFEIVDRRVAGDLLVDEGVFTLFSTLPGDPPIESRGRFMVVSVKEPDGVWRWRVDAYANEPAPKAP